MDVAGRNLGAGKCLIHAGFITKWIFISRGFLCLFSFLSFNLLLVIYILFFSAYWRNWCSVELWEGVAVDLSI
jgi:hypothetical protein